MSEEGTTKDQATFGLWTSLDYAWKNKKFEEVFEDLMPKEERTNENDNPPPAERDFPLPSVDPEVNRRYVGEASGESDQLTTLSDLTFPIPAVGWHLARTADKIKEDSIGLRACSIDVLKSTQLESVSYASLVPNQSFHSPYIPPAVA